MNKQNIINIATLIVVLITLIVVVATIQTPAPIVLGGSTSDDWNVGGALSVTGISTLTGEVDASRLRQGGSTATLTATASSTLTAANICDNSVLTITPTTTWGNPITLTLPATTTLYADCLTANGDFVEVLLVNATSSYGASTTYAEASEGGVEIKKSADTGSDILTLPQEIARLIFTRINSGTTTVEIHNFENGD